MSGTTEQDKRSLRADDGLSPAAPALSRAEAAEARVKEMEAALRYIADVTEAALDPRSNFKWGTRDTLDYARRALAALKETT